MKFAATQKLLTFLMAIASSVPLAASGEVSTVAVAIFGALVIAGWFLELPLTADPRFRRWVTGAIIGLLAIQIARALLGFPVAMVAMEFAILLLGLKLCSRARYFDYQQIAILSFLAVIAATVTTYDVSYAAAFVAFVVLAPTVLALAHLRNEMERRFRHDDDEGRTALSRLLASRRVVSGRFVLGTGLLSLPVLLVTVALFIAFPRFGLGFFGRLPAGDAVGGFTTEVRLGDIGRTRLEERVILRLERVNRGGDPPDRLRMKMRGAAFDVYDGTTWKRAGGKPKGGFQRMKGRGNHHRIGEGFFSKDDPGYDILLEPLDPPYLFVPAGTGEIVTEPVAKSGAMKPRKLEMDRFGVIRYDDPSKVGIRYRVIMSDAEIPGPAKVDPAYLSLPEGSGRLVSLAREMARGETARERAASIGVGLKTRYGYSVENPATSEDLSPIDDFLFHRRTGTCEHFATASTLMLRAVGIPSRMVTGFSSATWNPIGGYYAVQARSAHAWTEALIDGRWATLDATPPAPAGQGAPSFSTIAMVVDAIRMRWHKHVIGYDASTQMDMAVAFSRMWRGSSKGAPGARDLPWRWIGLAALLAVAGVVAWRKRRYLAALLGSGGPAARRARETLDATRLYHRLERRLAAIGQRRPAGLTPLEHLRVIERTLPGAAGVVEEITLRYNDVRFGGGRFEPGELGRLIGKVSSLGSRGEG